MTTVWGIPADLTDRDERRLKSRWPLIQCEDKLAATEGPDWSCSTGEQLAWCISEEHAHTFATPFQSEQPIPIECGQLVAIAGPEVVAILKDLDLMPEVQQWWAVQNGYRLQPYSVEDYESTTLRLADSALRAFDEAVLDQNLERADDTVRNALLLVRATAKRADEQILRWLYFHHSLCHDADTWRTTLELEAAQRRTSPDALEKLVFEYEYSLIQKLALRRSNAIIRGEGPPTIHFERLQYLLRSTPVSAMPALKQHIAAFLNGCSRFQNGANPRQFGEELGQWIGHEQHHGRLAVPFERLWGACMEAVEDAPTPGSRIFLAEMLRARSQVSADFERWKFERNPCEALPEIVREHLLWDANKVTDAMNTAGMGTLDLGVSEYPEDQILADLATAAVELTESKKHLIRGRVRYGTLQLSLSKNPADLACVNELLLSDKDLKSGPVFEHVGYYTFVSRKYIENPLDTWPDEVKQVAEFLARGQDWPVLEHPEVDLRARCWIAVEAGLTTYHDSEYRDLTGFVVQEAKKVLRRRRTAPLKRSESIRRDFEHFITGERDMFLGGSVHARLILNWWTKYSSRFIVLLNPSHFEALIPDRWPLSDRLWFGNSLAQTESLRVVIENLYLRVAEEVFQLTTGTDDRLMKNFAGELLARGERDKESHWNFVVNPGELIDLLTQDNRPVGERGDGPRFEDRGRGAPNVPKSQRLPR